jgi:hypothetical protein
MKRVVIIACLTSFIIAAGGAYAADGSTNAPPMIHRPMRPMMDSILGPRVFDALALTSDQQAKYNTLNADFKKDVAKWEANNGPSNGTTTNAPPRGGRQELHALRKSYVEKVRAFLTADQNAKLTQIIENTPGRGRRGAGQAAGANPATQSSPSESK